MAMVDDFTNYDWFARSDDITILKDIILKLHNAYVDKVGSLSMPLAEIIMYPTLINLVAKPL